MKQLSKISAIVILLGGFATTLIAQPYGNGQQRRQNQSAQVTNKPFMMIPDLTDAQQEQINAIHVKTMKEVQPLTNQLREKRAHLRTLCTAEAADLKAINKQIDDISAMQASIRKLHAKSMQEIRGLLTDEQRVAFDAHGNQRMGRGAGFGPGHGRGRGAGAGFGPGSQNCPFNN